MKRRETRAGRRAGARAGLPRVPAMPFCLAVSVLAHLNLALWVDSARGQLSGAAARPVELLLEPAREAERVEATASSPKEPEEEEKHFVDIPDEKADEGPPKAATLNIGIRNLRARDERGAGSNDDTPRAKGNTEAPIIRPGPTGAGSSLWPVSPFSAPAPSPAARAEETKAEARQATGEAQEMEGAPPGGAVEEMLRPRAVPDGDVEVSPDRARGEAAAGGPGRRTEEGPSPTPAPRLPGAPYEMSLLPQGTAVVQRNPQGGAAARGTIQYNVKQDEYAPYYKHLFDRVRLAFAIRRRLVYRQPLQLKEARVITIGFRVARDGKFEDLAVLNDGGMVLVASDLMDAVGTTSPVDPFPSFVKENELHIRVRVYVE